MDGNLRQVKWARRTKKVQGRSSASYQCHLFRVTVPIYNDWDCWFLVSLTHLHGSTFLSRAHVQTRIRLAPPLISALCSGRSRAPGPLEIISGCASAFLLFIHIGQTSLRHVTTSTWMLFRYPEQPLEITGSEFFCIAHLRPVFMKVSEYSRWITNGKAISQSKTRWIIWVADGFYGWLCQYNHLVSW